MTLEAKWTSRRAVLAAAVIALAALPLLAGTQSNRQAGSQSEQPAQQVTPGTTSTAPAGLEITVSKQRRIEHPYWMDGRTLGCVDFHLPSQTTVVVNGTVRGTAEDFDGEPSSLQITPGWHQVTLTTPDGQTWTKRVHVLAGHKVVLESVTKG